MKKRIITILATLALAASITACGVSGTYTSTNAGTESIDDYYCYYCDSTTDYLDFLKTFNHEKYNIIDISHGQSYWYVTYKLK